MNSAVTRFAFLAGCVYFTCIAVAHFFGVKAPLLFVYYDTPFYAYQDKIISFSITAYIGLWYAASRSREVVPVALVVGALTVLGLASVNMSPTLTSLLEEGQKTSPSWVQAGLIAAYWVLLVALWRRDAKAI